MRDAAVDPFQDTIAAIATPPGEGGIGVVRMSGLCALEVAARIFRSSFGKDPRQFRTHTLHHGHIVDPATQEILDDVLLLLMRAPKSSTGEEVVEIHGHGGRVPLQAILHLTLRHGARSAMPGEFTRRAFLNGRLDLAQAEAVLDIVQAKTEAGLAAAMRQLKGGLSERIEGIRTEAISLLATLEASVDFPEEDLEFPHAGEIEKGLCRIEEAMYDLLRTAREGRLLREGARVVLAGRPNVGKSSLLNALLQEERAIVSPIPGTTRDTVEEELEIRGFPVRLIDTAGLRAEGAGPIEEEGLRRARRAIEQADLTLVILDGSAGITPEDLTVWNETDGVRRLVVNKIDLSQALSPDAYRERFGCEPLFASAKTGEGVEEVKREIGRALGGEMQEAAAYLIGVRHREALERAQGHLETARHALGKGYSLELVALDVRGAVDALGEILGEKVTEEVLDQIFQNFCIGK
jgi:tRNA modification GTPase